jgi:phage shock protein E
VSGNLWLWILVAAVVAAMLLRRVAGRSRVSPDVVREKIEAGATIVDVRSPGEFQSGAYPGALNIPVQELDRRLGELRKDRPIVVYCASGMRSASAERLLRARGFADVVNGGGIGQMPR